MKKLLVVLVLVFVVTPTFAQYGNSHQHRKYSRFNKEIYYGLRLGLNITSLSSDIVEMDLNSWTGLAVGGVIGYRLTDNAPIWLESGLWYSEKGGKTTYLGDKVTCRLSYLQIPFVCKYSLGVADDLSIQPFLGGFFAIGVGGKVKEYAIRESHSSFDDVNRFDAGLRVGCGAEFRMVYAELGFDFGLANISKNDFASTHTRNFFINVGVNF